MYLCTPSSTHIPGLNFNRDPQGSFLEGRKMGIAATRKLSLHYGEGGNGHRSRLQLPYALPTHKKVCL